MRLEQKLNRDSWGTFGKAGKAKRVGVHWDGLKRGTNGKQSEVHTQRW